jgi:hypothetical protein
MSPPPKAVPNFSLPFYSKYFNKFTDMVQPHPNPLRSNPPGQKPELPPALPVPAKSALRINSLPILLPSTRETEPKTYPQPLPSNPTTQLSTHPPSLWLTGTASPQFAPSSLDYIRALISARRALLKKSSRDHRSVEIRKRMDKGSGQLLLAAAQPPTTPPAAEELDSRYFLCSLSRSAQRARVGNPDRRYHLLPSIPAQKLKEKLKNQVIERCQLQQQEQAGNNGRLRCSMYTLCAMMLKGNKQAEAEYFQRWQEELVYGMEF